MAVANNVIVRKNGVNMIESYSKFALTETEKERFKDLNDKFIKHDKSISDDTRI